MMKLVMTGVAVAALAACGGQAPVEEDANSVEPLSEERDSLLANEAPASTESEDALVAGTDYNARGDFPCGIDGAIDATCSMGVKRGWDDEGGALVEVTKPDGTTRAIYFDASGTAYGADSAQADGSAAYDFSVSRDEDWSVIEFGPERYRVPDMLVMGG